LFHSGNGAAAPPAATPAPAGNDNPAVAAPNSDVSEQHEEKKGGVLRKFFSIFKGKSSQPANPPDAPKKAAPEQ